MPGLWDVDEFQESGFASVKEFIGVMTDLEEDVVGQYGDQLAFHWSDVELTEAGDDVVLDEGRFTDWIKQNSRTNSVNQRMLIDYLRFKTDNELDGSNVRLQFIHGLRCRYRKEEYDFGSTDRDGNPLSPGTAFIPVEIIGDEKPKKSSKKKASKKAFIEEPDEPEELDDKLVSGVLSILEEDGATAALIKTGLTRKATTRKLLTAAGGIDTVLDRLVADALITEDDGVFALYESDVEDDDDEDDEELV